MMRIHRYRFGLTEMFLLLATLLLCVQLLHARQATNTSSLAPTAPIDVPNGQPLGKPIQPPDNVTATVPVDRRVIDAYRDGREFIAPNKGAEWCASTEQEQTDDCRERRTARLNEIIHVKVRNLEPLLNDAKCVDRKPGASPERRPNCLAQNVVLFLNGRPMKGLFPESGAPEIELNGQGRLRYHLRRYEGTSASEAAESDEHWADLLGLDPAAGQWGLTRDEVTVSVGLENAYPIPSDVTDFRLRRMRPTFLIGFLFLAVVIIVALTLLARRSDIVRDRQHVLWGQRKPYSLSATQAAWWFVLTIMSFMFIWMVTGEYDLSVSVLVLLGIGFGTALGSTVIDQSKRGTVADGGVANPAELEGLLLDKQRLETKMSALQSTGGRSTPSADSVIVQKLGTASTEYEELIRAIQLKYPNALGAGNSKFYLDLLSDANGVNFHRFQMAVWTIVLGIVFIYSVLSRLAMPKFSDTLLALMGISAGTYLGFKIPENQQASTLQPSNPAGPLKAGKVG